jgi:hypothetical protein
MTIFRLRKTSLSLIVILFGCRSAPAQSNHGDTLLVTRIEGFDARKDFKNSWVYFQAEAAFEIKVIDHFPATMECNDGVKTYSITIGTMKSGDTIRVLELCSRKIFDGGDVVTITPAVTPSECHTHPMVFVQGYHGQLRGGYYDLFVKRTTYGLVKRN